jgi:hypothetical protein
MNSETTIAPWLNPVIPQGVPAGNGVPSGSLVPPTRCTNSSTPLALLNGKAAQS